MEYTEDVEKIMEEECANLMATYKNVYDNVSEEIRKRKRSLNIRKIIYLCICISVFVFSYAYYDEFRRIAELIFL